MLWRNQNFRKTEQGKRDKMKLGIEKRQRIAKIFGRVAEYSISILILGSIISKNSDVKTIVFGFLLFLLFFLISVLAEPAKEEI